ncbi:hypothetical protein M885DRAFT_498889 [Pelagophyceae sp. CCMP2097]|nr:hypothetical protein M885DRAFT_498889 [Pelagophyceae sp. CCMP2097]
MPRDAQCGSVRGSAALSSLHGVMVSGKAVSTSRGVSTSRSGDGTLFFGPGDAVGVVAFHGENSCELGFSVNGQSLSLDGAPTITVPVPRNTRLYSTITFRSADVIAHCRFSADEMLRPHRAAVGAPSDVPVYAVDGTRVL